MRPAYEQVRTNGTGDAQSSINLGGGQTQGPGNITALRTLTT